VFRALNRAEFALLLAMTAAVALAPGGPSLLGLDAVLVLLLTVQLFGVRPRLNRRSDRVLAGEDVPRSREHHVYVVLEVSKVAMLVAVGTVAITA
jgi:hypothetical protein